MECWVDGDDDDGAVVLRAGSVRENCQERATRRGERAREVSMIGRF